MSMTSARPMGIGPQRRRVVLGKVLNPSTSGDGHDDVGRVLGSSIWAFGARAGAVTDCRALPRKCRPTAV
jgi:hypothetical protein